MSGHQLCAKLKQYSKLTICWFGSLDLIVFIRTRMYGVSLGNTLIKINMTTTIYIYFFVLFSQPHWYICYTVVESLRDHSFLPILFIYYILYYDIVIY